MKITGPILLIDDDEDDHNIFGDVCNSLGIDKKQLFFFHSGFQLLEFLRTTEEPPFIIFCDINMPHIDGLSLRTLINEDKELRRKSVPFIFFSTAASEGQIRQAYDLTVQGFFLKGYSYEETEEKIKNILLYWADCKHPNSV